MPRYLLSVILQQAESRCFLDLFESIWCQRKRGDAKKTKRKKRVEMMIDTKLYIDAVLRDNKSLPMAKVLHFLVSIDDPAP